MAGPQAQRPISQHEGTSASRALRPISQASGGDQHIEITVDDEQNRDKDVEHGGKKVRHRHHRRPLYRRVINYIRHAWTGVKFSSSNGNNSVFYSLNLCVSISLSLSVFFLNFMVIARILPWPLAVYVVN